MLIHRNNMGKWRCSRMLGRGPWGKLFVGYGALRYVPEDRLWDMGPCGMSQKIVYGIWGRAVCPRRSFMGCGAT